MSDMCDVAEEVLNTLRENYDRADLQGNNIYVWKNSLCGLVDITGKEILPVAYALIKEAGENTFVVSGADDSSFGVVDINGNVIIPLVCRGVVYRDSAKGYLVHRFGKIGFYDLAGNKKIPHKYLHLEHIPNTRLFIFDKMHLGDRVSGIITADGRTKVAQRNLRISHVADKVVMITKKDITVRNTGVVRKYWLEDLKGTKLTAEYDCIDGFDVMTKTIVVGSNRKAGLITLTNHEVLDTKFLHIYPPVNDVRFIESFNHKKFYMGQNLELKPWDSREIASLLCYSEDNLNWYFPKIFNANLKSSEREFKYEFDKEYFFDEDTDITCSCGSGLNVATKNWLAQRLKTYQEVYLVKVPKDTNVVVPTDLAKVRCRRGTVLNIKLSSEDVEKWLKQ